MLGFKDDAVFLVVPIALVSAGAEECVTVTVGVLLVDFAAPLPTPTPPPSPPFPAGKFSFDGAEDSNEDMETFLLVACAISGIMIRCVD